MDLVYSTPFRRKRFSVRAGLPETANMLPIAELEVPSAPEHGAVADDPRIERDQLVVAAAVERQILYLALADQTFGLLRGHLHAGIGVLNADGLAISPL